MPLSQDEINNLYQSLIYAELFIDCKNAEEKITACQIYYERIKNKNTTDKQYLSFLDIKSFNDFLNLNNIFNQFSRTRLPKYQPLSYHSNGNQLYNNFNEERQKLYMSNYLENFLIQYFCQQVSRKKIMNEITVDMTNIIYGIIPEIFNKSQDIINKFNSITNQFVTHEFLRSYIRGIVFSLDDYHQSYKNYLALWFKKCELIFSLQHLLEPNSRIEGDQTKNYFFSAKNVDEFLKQALDFRNINLDAVNISLKNIVSFRSLLTPETKKLLLEQYNKISPINVSIASLPLQNHFS